MFIGRSTCSNTMMASRMCRISKHVLQACAVVSNIQSRESRKCIHAWMCCMHVLSSEVSCSSNTQAEHWWQASSMWLPLTCVIRITLAICWVSGFSATERLQLPYVDLYCVAGPTVQYKVVSNNWQQNYVASYVAWVWGLSLQAQCECSGVDL